LLKGAVRFVTSRF